jgi:hypothetical protein
MRAREARSWARNTDISLSFAVSEAIWASIVMISRGVGRGSLVKIRYVCVAASTEQTRLLTCILDSGRPRRE